MLGPVLERYVAQAARAEDSGIAYYIAVRGADRRCADRRATRAESKADAVDSIGAAAARPAVPTHGAGRGDQWAGSELMNLIMGRAECETPARLLSRAGALPNCDRWASAGPTRLALAN
jgi:hypothetical protein